MSKKQPHEAQEEERDIQPIRRYAADEEEELDLIEQDFEDSAEDDAEDHTMEKLDDDDLANMQGPDA